MTTKTKKEEAAIISPPKFREAIFRIRGTTPLIINAMSGRIIEQMIEDQRRGGVTRRKRLPKDFEALYKEAMHTAVEGWTGFNASAIRNAVISACRTSGYPMTRAKLSIHVVADGYDKTTGEPLVRIIKGKPKMSIMPVKNTTGVVDLRSRPRWEPGWEADIQLRWDDDQFRLQDVVNLLMRAGMQVGIGAGRPDSKQSAGMGFGLFEIINTEGK